MSKVVDVVKTLVEKYAIECGVEIVEVEYAKKNNGYNLTIFIDKESGKVDIEDCVKLHRKIDKPLDELDPTKGEPYILNVSSCGIDRPFKTLRDYLRAIGQLVEIKFYQPHDGKKSVIGKLKCANEQIVELELENNEKVEIEMSIIASANVLFIESEENINAK